MAYYSHIARLDGYVRVSQVRGRGGESFISPASQRDRITAWAAAYGHQLVAMHEELDESGARADRPKLTKAIERVEGGHTDGIAVAKLDRFGRTLVDGVQLIDRIQKAGGTFASVADGFDISTDTGRLVLRIMLSLAEFELDRVRSNWEDARARAVARGIHPCATPPFGYRRASDGRLEPNPDTAPLVADLYARRSRGRGWTELSRWMEAQGAVTAGFGRPHWSLRALRDIIRSDVYLGVASHGQYRNENAHKPLVGRATWQRAQRSGVGVTSRADDRALLAGILRCGGCRYAMGIRNYQLTDGELVRHHNCRNGRTGAASGFRCEAPANVGSNTGVDEWVTEQFLEHVPELRARGINASEDIDHAKHALDDAEGLLSELATDLEAQRALGTKAYVAALVARQEIVDQARAALDAETEQSIADDLPEVGSIREQWPALTVSEQRRLLSAAIQCVFVQRASHDTPLNERLTIVWRGQRVDLPARGNRHFVSRPFRRDELEPATASALGQDR
jgi:DNA invertase Pin-like site-specific DNA recombinase